MPAGTDQLQLDSPSETTFGIPLDNLSRSRFEAWGTSSDDDSSVATTIGGLDEFICDSSNRWLRCLMDLELLKPLVQSTHDDSSDFEPVRCSSPIVFFGETGTGKTSLALSLVTRLSNQQQSGSLDDQPLCLAGSEFYRRYVAAMDRQSITEFRQRVLDCSGLLIDNIDQLESKFGAQRELVFLIDQLSRLGKPVLITMQHSPLEANHLVPQLLSRLAGGTTFPVLPPGLEARREIIDRLSNLHRISLTVEAAQWIAQKMSVSVPKLNHFFVQLKTELKARSETTDPRLPVDMAMLGVLFQQDENASESMATTIIDTVAADFEMTTSMLSSNSRKQTVVMARGVAIWLLRTILGCSYHKIGKYFGNRDHTTILHAFQKYDALIIENEEDSDSHGPLCCRIRNLKQRLNETFAGQMTLVP